MTRRLGVGYRVLFLILALGIGLLAVAGLFDSAFQPVLARVPFVAISIVVAVIFLRVGSMYMKATEDGVEIRNPLGFKQIRCVDVEEVFPTRNGLAFRLHKGRTVVAAATARSGIRGMNLRYDKEALAYCQAQIQRRRGPS